jgi:hypothetical protein
VVAADQPSTPSSLLPDRLLPLLINAGKPLTRTCIREKLGINNHKLGDTLIDLENKGAIVRSPKGWSVATHPLSLKTTENLCR